MKKILFFLVMIFILLPNVQGQPIQPYQENDYSIESVKKFALSSTELSSNWRRELLKIVNDGLVISGENMVLDESNIYWIFDHVTYERKNLINFTNSRRSGNEVKFFYDKNFDGMVAVFNYGQCSLVIYKTKCMNLLKVEVIIARVMVRQQFNPEPDPVITTAAPRVHLDDWKTVEPERKVEVPRLVVPVREKKHWLVDALICFIGASALVTGGYFLHKSLGGPGGAPVIPDNGGPGGAPITPPINPPVIPPPVDPGGGPGGANTTP